jgi:hypothetical protein
MSQLPGEASQKTKPAQNRFQEATAISHIKRHNVTINRNRNAIHHFRFIAIKKQSAEDFDTVLIFRQCNRKLKSASESTGPFKLSLKTTFEMNEVNYRPIDSCVNTVLQPDLMKGNGKWISKTSNLKTSKQGKSKTNCQNTETMTFYRHRKTRRGTQPDSAPNYAARSTNINLTMRWTRIANR